MPGHDIVVVGASAGGVEALSALARSLPADLPAAVFVVLHFPATSTSVLPRILNRAGPLRAEHARDGEVIEPGRIYIAPPDQHLSVRDGTVRLGRGPRENNHRPAVDPLFRSAARFYGPRVVGVVLSGTLDDGTVGLAAIKQRGGVAVVQHPEEALYSGMPRSALENVAVDHTLGVAEIGSLLTRLAGEPAENTSGPVPADMEKEDDMAVIVTEAFGDHERPGLPSNYSCPDCHGVLWELSNGDVVRFRCRVGHAYSIETLFSQQTEVLEAALWTALRALEEKAELTRRMLNRAEERGHIHTAARAEQQLSGAEQSAAVIRSILLDNPVSPPASPAQA